MFNNLSISKKISIAILLLTVCGLSIAGVSYYSNGQLSELNSKLQNFEMEKNFFKDKIIDHLNYLGKINNTLLYKNGDSLNLQVDHRLCKLGKFLYSEKAVELKKISKGIDTLFTDIMNPHEVIHQATRTLNSYVKAGDWDKAGEEMKKIKMAAEKTISLLSKIDEEFEHEEKRILQTIEKIKSSTSFMNLIALILFIVVDIWILISVILPVIRASGMIIERTESLSEGAADLTRRIDFSSGDEYGKIAASINKFIERMEKIIIKVKANSQAVSSAALQISSSAEELAATVEEQSHQAQSVSTSISELSSTSADIAVSMEQSRGITEESSNMTEDGSKIIEKAIDSLKQIEGQTGNLGTIVEDLGTSSNQIGAIVEVINDVADQTNLLALNAAIEAARAGEHGRGFAVVADEVRKLAERTGKATDEIVAIIASLQKKSEAASEAMSQTAEDVIKGREHGESSLEILGKIVESGSEVQRAAESVAAAIEEENATIAEISDSLREMATGTEESATAVQEVSTTADDLAKEAENLQELVNQFVTG